MRSLVISGDADDLSPVLTALESAESGLHQHVTKSLKKVHDRKHIIPVIGNTAIVYKRMVEAMTAIAEHDCHEVVFICLTYNEAWFLENRNKLVSRGRFGRNAVKESVGNRCHLDVFRDIVSQHHWFNPNYSLVAIESALATHCRMTWDALNGE